MNRGPIRIDTISATSAGDEDSCHCAATPPSASATTSSPTARDPFTSTVSPGTTTVAHELDRARPRRAPTRPARSRARARRRRPRRRRRLRAYAPTSSWKRGASAPSSAISPSTATVRLPAARSRDTRARHASTTGFAFQASLIRRPPPGSSISSRAPARERRPRRPPPAAAGRARRARVERGHGVRGLVARRERERDSRPAKRTTRPSRTSTSGGATRRTSTPRARTARARARRRQ